MYGPYLPSQMGLRQAGIPRKREQDNYYVTLAKSRVRRYMAGPAIKRDRNGQVIETEFRTFTLDPKKVSRILARNVSKVTLDNAKRVWYDCKCGKQTRRADGKCDHASLAFMGLDNTGKDHL